MRSKLKTSSSFPSIETRQFSAILLAFLVGFRLQNALIVRTFFQPDEYFQSLEPAWAMAFGRDSGAWITWEWRHQLRSSIHPTIFAVVYYLSSWTADVLHLSLASRADLLVMMPKVLQAFFAALGDYYTWRLARRTYGSKSDVQWVTLALTVCSPWQWFCSTRTLSNCLETTLTVMALCYWPWYAPSGVRPWTTKPQPGIALPASEDTRLGRSLLIAAIACILRPTNILIWMPLSLFVLCYGSREERYHFFRNGIFSGISVFACSGLLDRIYYGTWTLPVIRFLYYNLVQSLAVFYGRNPWHYYISQGVPLLLTTALPFFTVGIWEALTLQQSLAGVKSVKSARFQLAVTVVFALTMLSLISHKEVRFIYPLLPVFHLLAAEPLTNFLFPEKSTSATSEAPKVRFGRNFLVVLLLCINIVIGYYTTVVHQSGVISVMDYLRHQHEDRVSAHGSATVRTTVGFLMPCHSTPWRSHLVHPGIQAWALGCEPPVDLNIADRKAYVDEADRFYDEPFLFFGKELNRWQKPPPSTDNREGDPGTDVGKSWPDYLVFFADLWSELADYGLLLGYKECWRGFNSHWHDDWRRRGDVIVWCSR